MLLKICRTFLAIRIPFDYLFSPAVNLFSFVNKSHIKGIYFLMKLIIPEKLPSNFLVSGHLSPVYFLTWQMEAFLDLPFCL
jgi:hypothetical protein